MSYLLDTNICIYFLKGKFELADKFESVGFENLFISEITVAELKFGIENSSSPERNRLLINSLIQEFNILPIFPSLDIYAIEKARLRRIGEIVDDLDLLIGATAIYHEMVMVTNNEKHLGRMESIQMENWVK